MKNFFLFYLIDSGADAVKNKLIVLALTLFIIDY